MKVKLFLLLNLLIINSLSCTCIGKQIELIVHNINMTKGLSYLLSFKDNIVSYKVKKKDVLKVERITSIYGSKNSLLVTPLTKTNTELTIKTKKQEYKYTVNVLSREKIANTNTKGRFKLDTPPLLPMNESNVFNCELDKPPIPIKLRSK